MKRLIDNFITHIRKTSEYNANARVAPACILWTDEKNEWLDVISILQSYLPELFILGAYDPQSRKGPAIWFKCVLSSSIPETPLPQGLTPILYLPGVSYGSLRDTSNCPVELQPVVELLYRGVCYRHPNNRDWTIRAFLSSNEAMGYTVATDSTTDEALRRVLPELLQCDSNELLDKTIDSAFLNLLVQPDIPKAILEWLQEPSEWPKRCTKASYSAFRDLCIKEYGFDPDKDGPFTAAEMLTLGNCKWEQVWKRFVEAPQQYKSIIPRLERCQPSKPDISTYPSENKSLEEELDRDLQQALSGELPAIYEKIKELYRNHLQRKNWVWYDLGMSPRLDLLQKIFDLVNAIETAGKPPRDFNSIKNWFCESGFTVDKAAVNLGTVTSQFTETAQAWVRQIYKPWLEQCTDTFTSIVKEKGYQYEHIQVSAEESCVVLFVDGLRYDIAKLLAEKINSAGLDAVIEGRWSPVPTVTPTGKAVVAPVGDLKGTIEDARDGFKPRLPGNQSFNENSLKNLITKNSWQYLRLPEFGNPSGYAWASYGDLDNLGHSIGWKMIKTLENQLEDIVQNIIQLFSFGWKCMKIVTDHGWLLMPGGLSFTTLPTGLTQDKSSRCCLLKEGVTIDFLHLPWSFSGDVHVAFAPGISAFSNTEYAHGGISLQECIVPTLTVTAETKSRKEFKIEKIDWKGMRCRVTLSQIRKSFSIDIRLQPLDSSSSLLSEIKQCKEDSPIVSIPVENDDAEGKNGFIVVLDENGNMITEAPTVIGGN